MHRGSRERTTSGYRMRLSQLADRPVPTLRLDASRGLLVSFPSRILRACLECRAPNALSCASSAALGFAPPSGVAFVAAMVTVDGGTDGPTPRESGRRERRDVTPRASYDANARRRGPLAPTRSLSAGKATQRPKEKRGKDKAKWESKGADGAGDMDAFVEPAAPTAAAAAPAAVPPACASPTPPAPEQSAAPAPAAESNTAPPDAPEVPSYLSELVYKEGQYSPTNPDGKRVYDRDFLMALRDCPYARTCPKDMQVVTEKISKWKDHVERGSKNVADGGRGGGHHDFTPHYVKGASVSGVPSYRDSGRSGATKRPSLQGRRNDRQMQPSSQQQRVISVSIDDVCLQRSKNAWKPSVVAVPDEKPSSEMHEVLAKKVRGVLNKLTPSKFETLLGQVKDLPIHTHEELDCVIDLVFEKACDEPGFATAYASLCHHLSTAITVKDENDQRYSFRKKLLIKCQKEFEMEQRFDADRDQKRIEIEQTKSEEKRKEMMLDLEDKDRKMKRRYLGTIRFIGELFMKGMLTGNIMHGCVLNMLNGWEKTRDEDYLECLCKLLTTIGAKLDNEAPNPTKDSQGRDQLGEHSVKMNGYFDLLKGFVDKKETSTRVRCLLMDVVDLRKSKWVPRREDYKPKTIEQIHREARAEESKKMIEMNEFHEAKAQEKQRQQQQHRPRGTPAGTRGGNQQQPNNEEWQFVQQKRERQSYDTSRLMAAGGFTGSGNSVFAPQMKAWGEGAGGGASARSADLSNRFTSLSDGNTDAGRGHSGSSRSTTIPPRMQQKQGMGRDSFRNDQGRRGNIRGPGQDIRPSHSMGSSRDGSMSRFGDDGGRYGGKHGGTTSMMSSRDRDRDRDYAAPAASGARAPPSNPPPSAPPPLDSLPTELSGPANEEEKTLQELTMKFTDKYCFPDCDPSSESVGDVIKSFHETNVHIFVHEGLNHSVEKPESFRKKFGSFLSMLLKSKVLTADAFVRGVRCLLDNSEDLIIDLPKFWDYVGQCLSPVFTTSDGLKLRELKKCFKDSESQGFDKLATAILKSAGLGFLNSVKTSGGASEWVNEKSAERFRNEFLKELTKSYPPPTNDELLTWLNDRVAPECRGEVHFVRALVYAILDSTLMREGPDEEQKKLFMLRKPVLARFSDNKPELEMQVLIASTHLLEDRGHPKGMHVRLFEMVHDAELVAEETFDNWYADGSKMCLRGYAVSHEAMKPFFEWLRTAESDGDANDASEN
ncbi:unnamed protein product [Notodromas monacha]|uniref:Uncharacterized protein n=1 Tax=Notodromas monacha TaxID=399045 RepID=A0A7R9BH19_9CRUS|nr:unnamed protein product [Notodromas monacha]CAG0913967.1 unnamed protein product [Notodromas monacha]